MEQVIVVGKSGFRRNEFEKLGCKIIDADKGLDLALLKSEVTGKLILLPTGIGNMKTTLFAQMLIKEGVQILNKQRFENPPLMDKDYQYHLMHENGISTVDTMLFAPTRRKYQAVKSHLGNPLIVKPAIGSQGDGVHLIRTYRGYLRAVDRGKRSVVQRYIPNIGDYRVFMTRLGVLGVLFREGAGLVNNASKGATVNSVSALEVPRVINLAKKAFEISGLDYAGVDIIQDKGSGDFYLMEINCNPGWEFLQKFSSKNIAKEILSLFD